MKDLEEFKKSIYDKKADYELAQKRKRTAIKKLSLKLIFLLLPTITIALILVKTNTINQFDNNDIEKVDKEYGVSVESVLNESPDNGNVNCITLKAEEDIVIYPSDLECAEIDTALEILEILSTALESHSDSLEQETVRNVDDEYILTVTYENKTIKYMIGSNYIVTEDDTATIQKGVDTSNLIELLQSIIDGE